MTLIQIKLINGDPMGRPRNPHSYNSEVEYSRSIGEWNAHDDFEQSVTYHPAPGLTESDGVEAKLVTLEWVLDAWMPIDEPYTGKYNTDQIWVLSQKVDVKEVGMVSKEAVLKILERNRINFARLKTHSGDFGEHILYKIIEEIEALSPPTH